MPKPRIRALHAAVVIALSTQSVLVVPAHAQATAAEPDTKVAQAGENKEKNIQVDDFLRLLIEVQGETSPKETAQSNEEVLDSEAHYATEHREDVEQVKQMFDRNVLKKKTWQVCVNILRFHCS